MTATRSFSLAALALLIGSLIHVIGLVMGPDALSFLGAPEGFVQGARNGDWLWTLTVTLGIAGLLAGLAILAWRAKPPRVAGWLSRVILWLFTVIFIVRGLLTFLVIPAVMAGSLGPDPVKLWFHVFAGLLVLGIGSALFYGLFKTRAAKP